MADIYTGDELRDFCATHDIGSKVLSDAIGVSLASASNILAGRQWPKEIPTARRAAVDTLVAQHNGTDVLAAEVDPAPVPAADPAPAAPAFDWAAWAEQQVVPAQAEPEPAAEPEPEPAAEPGPRYRVSYIEHAATNQLQPAELTWSELTALFHPDNVTPGPKDGRGILFGHFTDNVRQKPNFQELDAFVIDGDSTVDLDTGEVVKGCIPPQQAHEILKAAQVPHLLFTTHSHDPARDYHRWRAVVFPSRPITSEEELVASVRSVWRVLWQQAPVYLSEESLKTAQLWYLPRVDPSRPDTYAVFSDTNAPLWDVDAALAAHRAETEATAKALQANPDAAPSVDIVRGLDKGDDLFGFYNDALGLEGLRDLLMARGYELHSTGRDTYRLLSPHSSSGSAGVVVYRHHRTGCPLVASHHDSDPDLEIGAAYTAAGVLARLYFGGDFGRVRRWLERLRLELSREERLAQLRTDLGPHAQALEDFARLSDDAQKVQIDTLKKATGLLKDDLRAWAAELGELLDREPLVARDGLLPAHDGTQALDFDLVAPRRVVAAEVFANLPDADDPEPAAVLQPGHCEWPRDFMVSERGTYFLPEGEEGQEPPKPIKLAGFIEVIGEARDTSDGEDWSLVVKFTDRDGLEHQALVPRAALFGDSSAFAALLTGGGCWLSNGKGHVMLLMSGLNRVRTGSRLALVRSTGWHEFRHGGRAFILPDWVCGEPPEGEGVFWSPAAGTYSNHKYHSRGTLAEWQDKLAAKAVGNRLLVFAISSAFAAPLLRLLGMGSVIFLLMGISSKGKSTITIVAGSVVGGDPADKLGFGHPWNQTAVGVEELAAAHSDALLCLDELKQAPIQSIEGIVYALAAGSGRGRGQGAGGLRPTKKWTTLVLANGEKTLDQLLTQAGRPRADAGTAVRMVSIPAEHHQHGAFEDLHGFADGAEFAKYLEETAKREQFGTAIREYMTHLVSWVSQNPQEAIESIRQQAKAWVSQHVPPDAGSQIRRIAEAMAVVAVAGEMASGWGVTGWEPGLAGPEVAKALRDVITERGTQGDLELHRGLMDLRTKCQKFYQTRFQFISEDYQRLEGWGETQTPFMTSDADSNATIVSVRSNRVQGERWGWVRHISKTVDGVTTQTQEIMIDRDTWKELTGDRNGSMKVAKAAHERGWLVNGATKDDGVRLTCRRPHPDTGAWDRFYVLDPARMFSDDFGGA